ncbi:Rv1733c family protein [Streptomyces sp. NPDC001595]|uniref:Rv1733c family protein n=1 Tax=Streptomyces sp. NPDC001532 TaxID=3154520 RepID=UPI0033188032
MRALSGLWRWRHNPLRRATDLAEAWLALVALLLVLLVAPVIGALVGSAAQDSLQRSVREQRQSRQQVTATVVRRLERGPLDADPETATRDTRTRVLADWTGPDGSTHQGPVMAQLESAEPGDEFRLWTDPDGRPVTRPLDSATAATHAVLAGVGSALLTAGLVEGFRRLVVWRMVRVRYARLDRAWEQAGPDWGRTGAGS